MYNKVIILIGRLTSTPELQKTNNDKSVRRNDRCESPVQRPKWEREADFVNWFFGGKWLKPWQATQPKVVLSLWMENFVPVALRKWTELCD